MTSTGSFLNYYEEYDEDTRLVKDQAHRVEFGTTTHFLDRLIRPGSKILDIGAGTGRYTFHYATLGHAVTAVEVVPRHVEVMRSRVRELPQEHDIRIMQGDATKLEVKSEDYDVVLLLGPLYHLREDRDKRKCLGEALRALKKGGIMAVAYISPFAAFLHQATKYPDQLSRRYIDRIVVQKVHREGTFCYMSPGEMEGSPDGGNGNHQAPPSRHQWHELAS